MSGLGFGQESHPKPLRIGRTRLQPCSRAHGGKARKGTGRRFITWRHSFWVRCLDIYALTVGPTSCTENTLLLPFLSIGVGMLG